MKALIIDDNTIRISATQTEIAQIESAGVAVDAIKIDNSVTFVCNSEPSANCITHEGNKSTLFNTDLSLNNVFSANSDLLIVFIQLSDYSYPVVIPCYNLNSLMDYIAVNSGVFDVSCNCQEIVSKADLIVLYYGFRLALSVLDYKKAIGFWKKIFGSSIQTLKCNCNEG